MIAICSVCTAFAALTNKIKREKKKKVNDETERYYTNFSLFPRLNVAHACVFLPDSLSLTNSSIFLSNLLCNSMNIMWVIFALVGFFFGFSLFDPFFCMLWYCWWRFVSCCCVQYCVVCWLVGSFFHFPCGNNMHFGFIHNAGLISKYWK